MPESADWAAETETRLLDAALPLVREHGWTPRLVKLAAADVGLTQPEAELLLPQGPRDLVALFSYRHDAQAMAALAGVDPAGLKVRERIAQGVRARVEAAAREDAALRRWMGFLALPQNLALAGRLAWTSADRIWRWAGDTSTDENHYSKRAILAGLLASTLAVRMSASPGAAWRHLDQGIEGVMSYERLKRGLQGRDFAAEAAAALGRLRYRSGPGADATPV